MKNKKLLFVLFTAIILTFGVFVYLQKRNEQSLSQEDLKRYESVYQEYPVQYLRKILDGYVANNFDGLCAVPPAITASDTNGQTVKGSSGLNSFDEVYYKSKFIVWSYKDNKENGKDIMILFKDKPDRLFYAWVGRDSEGEICLLGFNSIDNDPKILQNTIKTLKPSINDDKYSI